MASTSPTRAASAQTNDAKSLMRQNQELRDRLQEEASLYRRRLDTYKQAQQNQAALVGRLQSKVLQYKQKCNDLEVRCFDPAAPATGTLRVRGDFDLTFECVYYVSISLAFSHLVGLSQLESTHRPQVYPT